jgi:hypothetical protein
MRNPSRKYGLEARLYDTDQQNALVGQVMPDISQRSVRQNSNQSEENEITALLVAQDLHAEAEFSGVWCAIALEPVSAMSPQLLDGLGLFKETSGR